MQKAVSGFSLTGILNNNGLIQNVCHPDSRAILSQK